MMHRPAQIKILMTADAVGGVWTYAMNLARALKGRGIEFIVATMGPAPSRSQMVEAARSENIKVIVGDYALEWSPDPWTDVERAGEWLLDLERREKPDLIHLNGFCHGVLPFSSPVVVVGHSCCLSWWRAVNGGAAPEHWNEYRRRVGDGIAGADVFVTLTRAMFAEFQRLYRPPVPSLVINNGADAIPRRSFTKQPLILAAGRVWDEAKNISALSNVAPRLPWRCLVAGPVAAPEQPGAVDRPCANLERLGLLTREEIGAALSRASICVHPARYEPFGLFPLEAALAGCALVLGDIPTLRELWADAALYADPNDPNHLEAQLHRLIERPSLLAAYASAARMRARRFSLRRFGDAYERLYHNLVAVPGLSRPGALARGSVGAQPSGV